MQRADKRRYHYIYKITRDDGRYYIGMHSTDDLDDGYFGSGKLITRSIKKHGREKHTKEILEYLPTRVALKSRETELVNEDIIGDVLCMNLRLGGAGWESHEAKAAAVKGNTSGNRNREEASRKAVNTKRVRNSGNFFGGKFGAFAGKKHSVESKAKMSAADRTGEKNSQFGTCWISKDGTAIKIKKNNLLEYLQQGYLRGRK